MAETAVRVRGLRKTYGDHVAVDGLDLDIRRGEIFGILGPNGAGKSTTVEILEGHRKRDAGEVDVLGEDPGRASRRWKSRIGIVWQNEVVIGDLTVGTLQAIQRVPEKVPALWASITGGAWPRRSASRSKNSACRSIPKPSNSALSPGSARPTSTR